MQQAQGPLGLGEAVKAALFPVAVADAVSADDDLAEEMGLPIGSGKLATARLGD